MRTETTESISQSTDETDLSPPTIFRLLADDRRRYALHHLSQTVGAVPLDELADRVALAEGGVSGDRRGGRDRCDRRERVLAGLHHCHVPRLADAGVVRYDPERETVELRDAADQLAPYLKLAVGEDLGA